MENNNTNNDFGSKVKAWFSKSAKVSKEAIEKAGDKVQDFTDKSVLKIEKKQLETKREDSYLELGRKMAQLFADGLQLTIENEDDKKCIAAIQKEIKSLDKQIIEKDKEINA